MARSVGANAAGYGVLTVLIVVALLVGLYMYQRRDHGEVFRFVPQTGNLVIRNNRQVPEPRSPWLSGNFMFQSGKALRSALIWGGSVSIYVVLVTSVLNEVRDSLIELLNGSELIRNLYPVSTASFENLLGVSMFLVLVGVITAFAVTQVAGWTSEENEGRLELVLSTPAPRRTLLFSNYLVTLVASAFMLAIPGVAFAITAYLSNISINAGNALGGFFGLWVVAAVISGAGFLLAALKPGPAAAVLGGIVVLMFLADLLENVLKLPEWVVNLSVFQHLGQPLTEGLNWTANSVMLALAVVFIGAATIIFWRRDIVK